MLRSRHRKRRAVTSRLSTRSNCATFETSFETADTTLPSSVNSSFLNDSQYSDKNETINGHVTLDLDEENCTENTSQSPCRRKSQRVKKMTEHYSCEVKPVESRRVRSTCSLKTESKPTWQLICSTYNEWKALADKLADSKHRCEVALSKLIAKNFLDTVREMCISKVSKYDHGYLLTFSSKSYPCLTMLPAMVR